ncbi:MAG: hypothetical protein ACRD4K_03340 [Candidatus Acidiferrales bacterium]
MKFLVPFLAAFLFLVPAAGAAGPEPLAPLLTRTRSIVQGFVDDLGNLRYEETVLQQKLGENKKKSYKQETQFDSLMLMHFENGELSVEESRIREMEPRKAEVRPLLLTSGFSTLAMVFHPYYESSFQFSRMDDDVIDGRTLVRVHFEHVQGTPSPMLYQRLMTGTPVELEGTAWIDPDSGQIVRLSADVGKSMQEIGLTQLQVELQYAPVTMSGSPEPLWLPSSATIDLETPKQHWRNTHRFTKYRRYTVDVQIDVGSKQP